MAGAKSERVYNAILAGLESGRMQRGERVASVRQAAAQYGVSKNTVVEAYDRLAADGVLESRAGAGFFVARAARPPDPETPAHVAAATDHVSLLREQLEKRYSVRIGDGRPPSHWTEASELGRLMRLSAPHVDEEHGYSTPQGYGPLRDRIAQILCERGVDAVGSQIVLTFGANHALDLIVRNFLEPGDCVMAESPGYYPLFGKLKLQRATIVPIARRADGLDLDALDAAAERRQPKLLFVQPLAQNPTGQSMTIGAMHRLLQLADKHGFLIVEDDAVADLLPAMAPRLAALDQLNRVLYVSTFAKTLSAGLRAGFVAAPRRHVQALIDLKMLSIVNTSGAVERLTHRLIAGVQYRRHLARLQRRVETATAATVQGLRSIGWDRFQRPAGGYYLWCPLPTGLDDLQIARAASAQDIFLAPSSIFTLDGVGATPALRINVAYGDDPLFLSFLADLWRGGG